MTRLLTFKRQHKELHHRVGNVENLQLYAQSTISKHQALDNAMANAKARSKHWEREAKVGAGKTARVERKRDEAKEKGAARPVSCIYGG